MGPAIEREIPESGELALVMTGGGARAAYQVGCLAHLVRAFPGLTSRVLTGVSAGAINAASLAAGSGDLALRVARLEGLWRELEIAAVFRSRTSDIWKRALYWGVRLVSGGHRLQNPSLRGLVDTAPLWTFLQKALEAEGNRIPGIAANLESGRLRAIAVTGSSYSNGQSVTWVQGRDIQEWKRANRISFPAEIGVEHIMASAALPLFFPAVEIHGRWYGDGGMRLAAPLSPAIHLGAEKLLVVSTRFAPTVAAAADRCFIDGYPPPAQIVGALLNSVFLDQLDQDAERLERVNALLEELPEERRGLLRHVSLFVLRPSRDLGELANEYEFRLPGAFRFLTRGLGTRETRSNDLLSLLMFQPDYLAALIELGRSDTKLREDELRRFLTVDTAATAAG